MTKPGSSSCAKGACPSSRSTCPSCWHGTATLVAFTTDLGEAVEQSEAVFIAVGTPQGDSGAADLSYVEAVVAEIARTVNGYKVIVEKSTVPVYTNDWIRRNEGAQNVLLPCRARGGTATATTCGRRRIRSSRSPTVWIGRTSWAG